MRYFCVAQFQVVTYDTGEPQYRRTADVIVNVQRNSHAPQFLLRDYIVVVDQKSTYGLMVVNTTAVDLNGVSPTNQIFYCGFDL